MKDEYRPPELHIVILEDFIVTSGEDPFVSDVVWNMDIFG